VKVLLKRAQILLKTGGFATLIKQGFIFLAGYLFQRGNYYLYEHDLKEMAESEFLPRIRDYTFRIISSNKQADELNGLGSDFRSYVVKARTGLDKGAVAFCFFINGELAHIGWVALNEEAKNTFDSLPYQVDFSHNQACTGGTWTNPKFRGKGLMVYGYYERFRFLMGKGVKSSRNAVDMSNYISQKAHARFSHRIYAKARYLKVLTRKSFKETPVP
jgi:hypothetical protein